MPQEFNLNDIVTWTTQVRGFKKRKVGRIIRFFNHTESASYIADTEFKDTHKKMFRKCFANKPGVLIEELTPEKNTHKLKLYKPYLHHLIKTEV